MPNSRDFITSLSRGFNLLSIVADSPEPLGLSELSQMSGLSTTTVHRLTYTLLQLDILIRSETTKKFHLGPALIRLAQPALSSMEVRKVALPFMEKVSKEINENISLGVLIGVKVVIIERINANNILSMMIADHSQIPASCFAIGKVLLANLPPEEQNEVVNQIEFNVLTKNAIRTKKALFAELKKVKARGYGLNNEEAAYGARAIAAPVLDHTGGIIAAVNIMIPAFRVTKKKMETHYSKIIIELAETISFAMGYHP